MSDNTCRSATDVTTMAKALLLLALAALTFTLVVADPDPVRGATYFFKADKIAIILCACILRDGLSASTC